MVIFWDVIMFMPGDPYKILDEVIAVTGKYLLFSVYPVKLGRLTREELRRVLDYLDSHPRLRLVAKSGFNRIYQLV